MLDDPAILSVSVVPYYGSRQAVVRWTLSPNLFEPSVFVYRSDDNGGTWKRLNEEPVTGVSNFTDTGIPLADRLAVTCYRLLVLDGSQRHHSGPVGFYASLTPREFALCRGMVYRELMVMSRNGLPAFYAPPLLTGEPADNYDPATSQMNGACDPEAFGQPFKGGFGPPVQTWVNMQEQTPFTREDRPEGDGMAPKHQFSARMPAWPVPMTGGLVVLPTLARRYAVGASVQGFHFKAQAPVAWMVPLQLLDLSDPRQGFPVPALAADGHIPLLLHKP